MRTSYVIAAAVLLGALVCAGPALAFDETGGGETDCTVCHTYGPPVNQDSTGPHGGYSTTTNKCETCHTIHQAPAGIMLLPGATIRDTCFTCHDGTGGNGVYGAIASPQAEHRIDATLTVPGGDPITGGDADYTFTGENSFMSCDDCHSPHNSSTVATFTGDRLRVNAASNSAFFSNRLLKKRPNGSLYDIDEYGSDWCGACHKGRLTFGSGINNHPVESTATTDYYHYEGVARVTGFNVSTTETGTVGQTNFGYVMPYPRTTDQEDHYPICQQCHEDARSVGDVNEGQVDNTEDFDPRLDGGGPPGGNPLYQNFPHESENAYFLLETEDDLCTNCHPPSQLP
jgi:predicted CXXCH cytochrome family protein